MRTPRFSPFPKEGSGLRGTWSAGGGFVPGAGRATSMQAAIALVGVASFLVAATPCLAQAQEASPWHDATAQADPSPAPGRDSPLNSLAAPVTRPPGSGGTSFPASELFGAMEVDDQGNGLPERVNLRHEGETWELSPTGSGVRRATFLKIDVYRIASYLQSGAVREEPLEDALRSDRWAKQLRVVFERDVPIEKVREQFRDRIAKNFTDDSAGFRAQMQEFLALFQEDVREGEEFVFTFIPESGLFIEFRGAPLGMIPGPRFGEAYWSVYFGPEPESRDLRADLLHRIQSRQ